MNAGAAGTSNPMPLLHSLIAQMTAALSSQLVGGGLVLMLTGSVIALLRNIPGRISGFVKLRTTSVIEVRNSDPLFDYVTFWINGQERFARSRYLHATTTTRVPKASDDDDDGPSCVPSSGGRGKVNAPSIFFSPSRGSHYLMREGRWMKIERTTRTEAPKSAGGEAVGGGGKWQMEKESFVFTGFGRSQAVLKRLIEEIVEYGSKPVDGTRVWYSTYGYWQCLGRRKMRSLKSVILPAGVSDGLLADARKFLADEEWYREVGIPWHHGYLFFGVPGSGKTSLAAALAGELHMDLYLLNIGGSGMSDEKLTSLMADIRPGSMIVMEDIDCTVPDREALPNRVTLSGLLNCLDGIMSREGCMIVMTTNRREILDEALIRPGRVDMELEFGYANDDQKARLALALGGDVPDAGAVMTMAECQQKILAGVKEREVVVASLAATNYLMKEFPLPTHRCACAADLYVETGPVCPECHGSRV